MVRSPAWLASVNGLLTKSLVDHCYSTDIMAYSTPEVIAVESCDHLGQVINKLSHSKPQRPKTIKSRNYKIFSEYNFCRDLWESDVVGQVMKEHDVTSADRIFHRELKYIRNKWAPSRTVQL